AMMRVRRGQKDMIDSGIFETSANVARAFTRRRAPEVEAYERQFPLAHRQNHDACKKRIVYAGAGRIAACGVSPQGKAGRRRDIDFGDPGVKILGAQKLGARLLSE